MTWHVIRASRIQRVVHRTTHTAIQRVLAMSATASGDKELERALALSAQAAASGAADADDLQRAIAMSAAETGTDMDPELQIALAISKEGGGDGCFGEEDDVMQAIAMSRDGHFSP